MVDYLRAAPHLQNHPNDCLVRSGLTRILIHLYIYMHNPNQGTCYFLLIANTLAKIPGLSLHWIYSCMYVCM